MTKDIRTHLNSAYVAYSNKLRKKEIIQVYVEDEIDKIFWHFYLHPYESIYHCSFRISTLQDRNKVLKGKASLLSYKQQNDLGHNMWLCIDSDYDELIKDFSVFSKRIKQDNFVITTWWYSIENLKCMPELLEMNILKASLADNCDIDVRGMLQTISILYKNMFLLLLEMEEKHDNRFKIEDFCKNLSFVCFSEKGKLEKEQIECEIKKWRNSHLSLYQQYGHRFNHWEAKLRNLGFNETDYYQLYNGHGLLENVAVPLVKFYAHKYRTIQLNTIINGADKKERKENLIAEYYNNTFTSKDSGSLLMRVKQLVIDNQPNINNSASMRIKKQIENALTI